MVELPNQNYFPPQQRRRPAGLVLAIGLLVLLLLPAMLLACVVAVGLYADTNGVDLLTEVDFGCDDVGSVESLSVGEDGQLYHWATPVSGVSCPVAEG